MVTPKKKARAFFGMSLQIIDIESDPQSPPAAGNLGEATQPGGVFADPVKGEARNECQISKLSHSMYRFRQSSNDVATL